MLNLQFRIKQKDDHWIVQYKRRLPFWLTFRQGFSSPVLFKTPYEAKYAIKIFINKTLPKPRDSTIITQIQDIILNIEYS